MRKFTLFIIAIVCSFNINASEAPSRDDVIEYFKITDVKNVFAGYSKSYIVVLRNTYPDLSEKFYSAPELESVMKEYERRLFDESVSIIRSNITKNDLNEIIKFLKTETGKNFLSLQKVTTPLFAEAGTRTNLWLNDEVKQLIYKYEH